MWPEGQVWKPGPTDPATVAAPNASPNVFLAGGRMRKSGFGALVLRDVARRPSVETGASGPGYSGGAQRLYERLFGRRPDAKKRFRSHCFEGCGLKAKCGNRGQRTRLQRRRPTPLRTSFWDANHRFRTRRRGRQRSRAKCGNRGRRTRPAGSKLPCRALIRLRRLAALKGHRIPAQGIAP